MAVGTIANARAWFRTLLYGGTVAMVDALVPRRGYAVQKDIAYGPGQRQVLDIYVPDDLTVPAPVLLFFHGGSWQFGDKNQYRALGQAFASKGIVTVVANYRLFPPDGFPHFVEDGAQAFRYVREHAREWGGDADRAFLGGHSAGAHLVALVATNPRFLAAHKLTPAGAIKNVFPIDTASFDLTQPSAFVQGMVDEAFGQDEAVLHDASPVWNVTEKGSYPAFIMAATKVRQDAVDTSRALKKKLLAAGGSAELLIVDHPGLRQLQAHGQIAKDLQDMNADMTKRLLARVLQQ